MQKVVRQLSHTVEFDFEQIEATTRQICQSGVTDESLHAATPAPDTLVDGAIARTAPTPTSASSVQKGLADGADTMLAHAEDLPLGFGFTDLLNNEDLDVEEHIDDNDDRMQQ